VIEWPATSAMNELQSLVDALAADLGRPVGVDDRRFRVVAYSSHQDGVDPVRLASILQREAPKEVTDWLEALGVADVEGYLRLPANPLLGMAARVCVPVRFDDSLLGYLWLIDEPRELSERELRASERCAEDLGAALFRARILEHEDRDRELVLLARLCGEPLAAAQAAAVELVRGGFLAAAESYAVIALQARGDGRPPPDAVRVRCAAAMDQLRRRVAPRHLLTLVSGDVVVGVVAVDAVHALDEQAAWLLGAAERTLAGAGAWHAAVGVGDVCAPASETPRSYRHALLALRLADRVEGIASPVHWSRLGAYRLISDLAGDVDVRALLPAALLRLLECDEREPLVTTLECYLDLGGDVRAAAEALFVHRSTLYQRLHRIQDITGADLGAGDDRLELHLGLRLWRMGGVVGGTDIP
jgi:hypothetical protein